MDRPSPESDKQDIAKRRLEAAVSGASNRAVEGLAWKAFALFSDDIAAGQRRALRDAAPSLATADDLKNEFLIHMHHPSRSPLKQYDRSRGPLGPFLLGAAYNHARNILSAQTQRPRTGDFDPELVVARSPAPTWLDFSDWMFRLDVETRLVFMYRHAIPPIRNARSVAEIARILDVSPRTVRRKLAEASQLCLEANRNADPD